MFRSHEPPDTNPPKPRAWYTHRNTCTARNKFCSYKCICVLSLMQKALQCVYTVFLPLKIRSGFHEKWKLNLTSKISWPPLQTLLHIFARMPCGALVAVCTQYPAIHSPGFIIMLAMVSSHWSMQPHDRAKPMTSVSEAFLLPVRCSRRKKHFALVGRITWLYGPLSACHYDGCSFQGCVFWCTFHYTGSTGQYGCYVHCGSEGWPAQNRKLTPHSTNHR